MSNKSMLNQFKDSELSERTQEFVQGGVSIPQVTLLETQLKTLQQTFSSASSLEKKAMKAGYLAEKDVIKCEIESLTGGGNGDGVW